MVTFRGRESSQQDGFTIIELTVALGLLVIVGISLTSVFWSAVRTGGVAAHRTDGSSIASRELEAIRAVPYASVGFYGDQSGYVPLFDGFSTVTLASSTPLGVTPPIATSTSPIMQGNVAFSVTRNIVWVNARDASTNYTNAYKRLTVTVAWTDVVGPHSVREDSLLYPGGQGSYAGSGTATSTSTTPPTTTTPVPTTPTLAAPTVPADPAGRTEIDLTWSQPGGGATIVSYTVQYSTSSTFPPGSTSAIANLPPGATSYAVTALASNTTYYFAVTAIAASHSATSTAQSATTLTQPVPTCTLGALVVTGATSHSTTGTILSNSASKMSEDLALGFSTTGTCTASYQVKGVDPGNAADQGSAWGLIPGGSGTYSATVSSSGQKNWAIGVHTFTVWNATTNSATTAVKTFKVCANGVPSC